MCGEPIMTEKGGNLLQTLHSFRDLPLSQYFFVLGYLRLQTLPSL